MVESLPFQILLGTVFGFLAGIGVGGGSLLMLWLTVVLGQDHAMARSINLLFFLPAALIACCFRWKQGTLDLKAVLPAIIAGCTAAGICSWLGTLLDTGLMKKLYGGLLIVTGARELLYKSSQNVGQGHDPAEQ